MYWLPRLFESAAAAYVAWSEALCSWSAALQIWILVESKGAYWSWIEQTSMTFLNHSRPGNVAKRYRHVSSYNLWSVILSCVKHFEFRHFLSSHIPASNNLLELYMYPRCGEPRLINVKNFGANSARWGKAARIIRPPIECPMKLILLMHEIGQKDSMYCLTSVASRSPISIMSPSVWSSLLCESKMTASGCCSEIWFLNSLMSLWLPWNPCCITKRCTPTKADSEFWLGLSSYCSMILVSLISFVLFTFSTKVGSVSMQ